MAKVAVKEEKVKKQTLKDIKKASKINKKEEKKNQKVNDDDKTYKVVKKSHIKPSKIFASVIVWIIVATMLFGACATLIFYMMYYA